MAEDRSVSDVLQDILRNLQDMVRSEIRLAKVEIREEARRAVSSGTLDRRRRRRRLSAWIFLLWTAGLRACDPDVDVGRDAGRRGRDGRLPPPC